VNRTNELKFRPGLTPTLNPSPSPSCCVTPAGSQPPFRAPQCVHRIRREIVSTESACRARDARRSRGFTITVLRAPITAEPGFLAQALQHRQVGSPPGVVFRCRVPIHAGDGGELRPTWKAARAGGAWPPFRLHLVYSGRSGSKGRGIPCIAIPPTTSSLLGFPARVSAVEPYTTALERAFQLAKSGNVATIDALRRQLKAEGYLEFKVTGKALTTQLRALIQASQKPETTS
jgi:hypothetical protein